MKWKIFRFLKRSRRTLHYLQNEKRELWVTQPSQLVLKYGTYDSKECSIGWEGFPLMAPGHHSHRHRGCGNPPAIGTPICIVKWTQTVINTSLPRQNWNFRSSFLTTEQSSNLNTSACEAVYRIDPHWFQVPTHPNPEHCYPFRVRLVLN